MIFKISIKVKEFISAKERFFRMIFYPLKINNYSSKTGTNVNNGDRQQFLN
jgi:hypothetical protein